ncbi:MAG: outer rane transport energization protein TonB [Candidatus Angelobacter sp.]|nr:outer rane transport energization protein TonB [Candidatus Angelobacter sp.]
MNTTSPSDSHASAIHTIFGQSTASESTYPSFARSLLFHALAIALVFGVVIVKPALIPPIGPSIVVVPTEAIQYVGNDRGGGRQEQLPASIGVAPPRAKTQITPPQVELTTANPLLPVMETITGPPHVQLAGEIGSPTGLNGPKSNGTGDGRSIGDGIGNSVGNGTSDIGVPGHGGVTIPRPIYMPDPEFSEAARKARHQGIVTLWVVLNAQGRVERERVHSSLGMGLDEQAIAAVRNWRFEPATKNGRPIPVQMYVEVSFRLY